MVSVVAPRALAFCAKKMMANQDQLSSMLATVCSTGIKRYRLSFSVLKFNPVAQDFIVCSLLCCCSFKRKK